jgi:hypothetical protein
MSFIFHPWKTIQNKKNCFSSLYLSSVTQTQKCSENVQMKQVSIKRLKISRNCFTSQTCKRVGRGEEPIVEVLQGLWWRQWDPATTPITTFLERVLRQCACVGRLTTYSNGYYWIRAGLMAILSHLATDLGFHERFRTSLSSPCLLIPHTKFPFDQYSRSKFV